MTPETIRSTIATNLVTSWATCSAIAWPNRSFVPPDNSVWIRPSITMGYTKEGELGVDGVGIRTGVLMVSIFSPNNTGISLSNTLASRIETIFRRSVMNGIMFEEPYTVDCGNNNYEYYHQQVIIPFQTFVGE